MRYKEDNDNRYRVNFMRATEESIELSWMRELEREQRLRGLSR